MSDDTAAAVPAGEIPGETEAPQEAEEGAEAPARGGFTQEDVNRIVARERAAERRRIAQEQARQEAEARGEYQAVVAEIERERDAIRGELRRLKSERMAEAAARKANAEHPEVIVRLIRDDLEHDEEGNPTNVDALVAQAKKDYPRYFAQPAAGADGGRQGAAPAANDMDALIRRQARRG